MENRLLKNFAGLDGFIWWQGVVEDRQDPLLIGRVRVRIFGWHTEDKTKMPTENLPWALVMMPIDNGNNPVGLKEGDWVIGFYRDSIVAQEPIVFGVVPGIPTRAADTSIGFSDPTDADTLASGELPRPPEFQTDVNISATLVTGIESTARDTLDQFVDDAVFYAPIEQKDSLRQFKQQLTKLDPPSAMNLCQSFLNQSFDIGNILQQGGTNSIVNDLGVTSFLQFTPESQQLLQNGLRTISSLVNTYPNLIGNFTSNLQANAERRLFSLVQNNLPTSIIDALATLGLGNPINQILGSISLGQGFSVAQLFNGNVTQTVNSMIQTLLPTQSPLALIEAVGIDTAVQIGSFLGLGFGSLDESWEEIEEIAGEEDENENDPFKNENELPIQGTTLGVLQKDFDINNFPYDVDRDGNYDETDAQIIVLQNTYNGVVDTGGAPGQSPMYPMSRYPLEPFLMEPLTPREARNQSIELSSVGYKKSDLAVFSTASYAGVNLSLNAPSSKEAEGELVDQLPQENEPFNEPETPYNAVYPYNHVYKSESGHLIEIDDTPKAERLHWYHRSGTFREIHPDGTLVDKIKKKLFTISNADMFIGSDENISMTSYLSTRIKATTELVFESGSTMLTTGGYSIKCGTKMESIDGGYAQSVSDNKQVTIGGDYTVKVSGNLHFIANSISFDADTYVSNRANGQIVNESPIIGNNCALFNVSGVANLVPTFSPAPTTNSQPALEDQEEAPVVIPSKLKAGFVLEFLDGEKDAPGGYLYKPSSDSDGKPVVLTPQNSSFMGMYEAIPTGELEDVKIEYLHEDGTITTWEVTRPVHKIGKLIESGTDKGLGNPDSTGPRRHWRFSRFAKDYPKQVIMSDGENPFYVYDTRIRHD